MLITGFGYLLAITSPKTCGSNNYKESYKYSVTSNSKINYHCY